MPSLLDRELSSVKHDAFGHRHLARALESLIENPINEPPYSIGLLGGWGTGKSSIQSLYLTSLADDCAKDANRKTRRDKIHPVVFNAWRFGGDNIKRALLKEVYLSVGGKPEQLEAQLFREIQESRIERKSSEDLRRDICNTGRDILQIAVAIYSLKYMLDFISARVPLTSPLGATLATIIIGAITCIERFVFDPKRFIIPRYANITSIEPKSESSEQYEDLLVRQLKDFKRTHQKGKSVERIVVFVDDLDRLSAKEMVSGLNAIRALMDIPSDRLPDGLGIIFVISCDEKRVADALIGQGQIGEEGYQSSLPASVTNQADARVFLDRVFQFRLEVPLFPEQDMRHYASKKLVEALPDVASELLERCTRLDTLIERMIPPCVQNPRNALQILNRFVQCWWLAKQRERDGAGTQVHGGLSEGSVTEHPISLAVLCVLQVNFPDFYSDLCKNEDCIRAFTDIFIRGKALEAIRAETAGEIRFARWNR